MADKNFTETIDQIKEIKELAKKPWWALLLYFGSGTVLVGSGIIWMYVIYENDPASIKMTTTLPIFLITLGIGFIREAYRDS